MFKILSNKKGFSLVEVMIAVGILGTIAVSTMKLMENQGKTIKRFSNKSDEMESFTLMRYIMSNQIVCTNSLRGTVISPNGTDVKITTGNQVFEANDDKISNKKLVRIKSMKLKVDNGAGLDDRMSGFIEIIFLRDNRQIVRNLPVNLELEDDGSSNYTVASCRSVNVNIIEQARTDACNSMGGKIDTTTEPIDERKCYLACPYNLTDGTLKDKNSDVSWPYNLSSALLEDSSFIISLACLRAREKYYENTYVNASGDSISGSLSVSGNVNVGKQICIAGRCRTFSEIKCDKPGDRLTGINTDGTAKCDRFLVKGTCKPGEYVSGIKSNGEPECAEIPYVKRDDCPNGTFLAGVNPDGSLNCRSVLKTSVCPEGQVVTGLKNSGELECSY